ncbi:MAG: hypothetical protein LBD73_06730 [Deferribacteraceae bacterium]|jgi:ABC-type iron transport system FetAB ATPase subunit|nr:hypothetical protein [Deferribacteraceae bacterium]
MGGALPELREVSFSARNTDILQSISYCYEEGKTTALTGASGSGKNIMLKVSAGFSSLPGNRPLPGAGY